MSVYKQEDIAYALYKDGRTLCGQCYETEGIIEIVSNDELDNSDDVFICDNEHCPSK